MDGGFSFDRISCFGNDSNDWSLRNEIEVENAKTLLGMVRRKIMDYQTVTVWTVMKRFILGWLAAGLILVIISCVKYREFIIEAFSSNTLALINAIMPILIMLFGIWLMFKSVFR